MTAIPYNKDRVRSRSQLDLNVLNVYVLCTLDFLSNYMEETHYVVLHCIPGDCHGRCQVLCNNISPVARTAGIFLPSRLMAFAVDYADIRTTWACVLQLSLIHI